MQFPVGGRAGWQSKNAARPQTTPIVQITPSAEFSDLAFGGAWYHEVALHEDDTKPTRTN